MIGPKNSRHSLDQSDAKLQSITTWSPAFSYPLGGLLVFTLSFHLALQGIFLSSFHNNYFGFVLRHSIEKRSMNGNPYFPRRYKYSSSQRRNSSNLFFFGDICSLIKFVVSPCMITVTTSYKKTSN